MTDVGHLRHIGGGAVQRDQIQMTGMLLEEFPHGLVQEVGIMGVENGFAVLFDEINERTGVRTVNCGQRSDSIIADGGGFIGFQLFEVQTVESPILVQRTAHGFAYYIRTIYGQSAFVLKVGIVRQTHDQILRIEVVAVVMGDEAVADLHRIDAIAQEVHIAVSVEIDEEIVIDQRLGAGADMSSAFFSCFFADSTFAEEGGDTFGSSST